MLDRDGPVPVYKQIADILRDRIDSGELAPGNPVPSEADLEAEYGIARTTARRVARELREQGLVYTVQGEGTFVGDQKAPRVQRKKRLYQEIAEEVAQRIRQQEFRPNRAIPSEKALMRDYGVAKATVRLAVGLLRDQGYVFTVPHRGTYVSSPENWPQD
ncbi:GntR family transcriptional regulator [Microbispora triticiradicis]|uniref:GntR family transcriptional regulator n=1 Tax=Microbispora triticiradicis TaxID=2200763 RepID=UPI0027DB2C0F|nr:GntR family transcriptional regulator [Microbispora triticiradicis]MBO4269609.1 GntR family transcriptional regulator [Microbispora triticiradicis]